ncbi:MAG TPA: M23 family metallopeptidase [Flavobacteriales bacterium]|nr:M23 family metallopeptidase [Flavobacteriales bacterium]
MANKNFLDWSTFTDPSAGRELLNNSIRKGLAFDAYGDKKRFKFKARVLTNASYLTADGEAAINRDPPTSDEAAGSIANTTFKSFRYQARITGSNSPHWFLPDPCNATYAEKPVEAFRLIALHTTFVSTFDIGANATAARLPVAGQIVEVELEASDMWQFDLQQGFHVGIVKRELPSEQEETFCKSGEFFESYSGERRSLSDVQRSRDRSAPDQSYSDSERSDFCKEYPTLEDCAKAGNFYGPPLPFVVAPVRPRSGRTARPIGLKKCPQEERDRWTALRASKQGIAAAGGGFVMPVSGYITSFYGEIRAGISSQPHGGLDISAPNYSSPGQSAGNNRRRDDGSSGGEYKDEHYFMGAVIAPQAGKIVHAPPGTIWLECQTSPKTRFAFRHLDSFAKGLAENVTVKQGQILGRIGTTGHTSPAIGPHLHLEVYIWDDALKPGGGRAIYGVPKPQSKWVRQDPMEYCGWADAVGGKIKGTNLYRGFGCGTNNFDSSMEDIRAVQSSLVWFNA